MARLFDQTHHQLSAPVGSANGSDPSDAWDGSWTRDVELAVLQPSPWFGEVSRSLWLKSGCTDSAPAVPAPAKLGWAMDAKPSPDRTGALPTAEIGTPVGTAPLP